MAAKTFDVVVVGCGPAGLAAATAVAEAGLACLAIDRMGPGGQLINLGGLHDCPEAGDGMTGPDLVAVLADAALQAGVEFGIGEVAGITGSGPFALATDGDSYGARAVVIATGLGPGSTGLAEEARFAGRGLSSCAHCDGPLYRDQPVIVAGGGAWAVQEAIDLAGMVGRVTVVIGEADATARAALAAAGNVEVVVGRITGLAGDDGLETVTVATEAGARDLPARALFIYTDRRPETALLGSLAASASATPGLFSAGDVRAGARERITDAIADGRRAGQNAASWVKAGSR